MNHEHQWSYSVKDYGDCFYILRHCFGCKTNEEASGPSLKWYPLGRVELRQETAAEPTFQHMKECPRLYGQECNCNGVTIVKERDPLFDTVVANLRPSRPGTTVTSRGIATLCNITYARASGIVDQLEEAGIISVAEHGKPRKVL